MKGLQELCDSCLPGRHYYIVEKGGCGLVRTTENSLDQYTWLHPNRERKRIRDRPDAGGGGRVERYEGGVEAEADQGRNVRDVDGGLCLALRVESASVAGEDRGPEALDRDSQEVVRVEVQQPVVNWNRSGPQ